MLVEPLAIAPVLLAQLQQAITSLLDQGDRFGLSRFSGLPSSIPLYRAKDTQRILYISPIALQLGKQESQPPLKIAQAIAECFRDSRPPDSDIPSPALNWTLTVMPPGKLYLELTDPSIAAWLQRAIHWDLPRDPLSESDPAPPGESPDLFLIQYAHARCCALLRLAHRDGFITLQTLSSPAIPDLSHPGMGKVIAPNPLPWLDGRTQLKAHHPAERALISRAIATVDALSGSPSLPQMTSLIAISTELSQDFLTFYAQCQIWGSAQSQDPDLAPARLGLVSVTQKLLKLLLEKALGSFAPLEL